MPNWVSRGHLTPYFPMEPEPYIDKLIRGMENVMNMPEGPTKRGLIDAAIETVRAMHAREEITNDERRRLVAILHDPHVEIRLRRFSLLSKSL